MPSASTNMAGEKGGVCNPIVGDGGSCVVVIDEEVSKMGTSAPTSLLAKAPSVNQALARRGVPPFLLPTSCMSTRKVSSEHHQLPSASV